MPENYYCLDNFFQKMTDLESPRKNNDCYFYYYSTCTKGDNCTFRHEPSALGCETTCSFWKEGKCINVHCNFRHMELRKNRKTIPCYWESQPSGCKKPHCPFMHVSKKDDNTQENITHEEIDDVCSLKGKKDDFTAPVVDPIVVNFEEESDNESSTPFTHSSHKTSQSHDHQLAPTHPEHAHADEQTHSPRKKLRKIVQVKTLEEIKLDRIQAESAAYYSYPGEFALEPQVNEETARKSMSIFNRLQPIQLQMQNVPEMTKEVNIANIQVLSLDEIRKRKRRFEDDAEIIETTPKQPKKLRLKKEKVKKDSRKEFSEIKVKTLAEIKAERQKRKHDLVDNEENIVEKKMKKEVEVDEDEVSSTSKNDEQLISASMVAAFVHEKENDKEIQPRVKCIVAPQKRVEPEPEVKVKADKESESEQPETETAETVINVPEAEPEEVQNTSQIAISKNIDKKVEVKSDEDSKLDDLLLEDDEDNDTASMSLRAEDEILKDIDNLLNE